jgi:Big-like domain-containing protein
MTRTVARLLALSFVAVATACGSLLHPDKVGPPAAIAAVGSLTSAVVGTPIATPVAFKVTDANGRAVSGVTVTFAIAGGNGTVSPATAVTGSDGIASTHLTLGTVAGTNDVSATTTGVAAVAHATVDGLADAAAAMNVSSRTLRLAVGTDTARLTARVLDRFGNLTTTAATWTARDASLVSVDATGLIRVLRRGGATYVVASSGALIDSTQVTVLAPGDTPCTGIASAVTLAVGQVIDAPPELCIQAGQAGEEYVMMPYFSSSVASATTSVSIIGSGLGVAPSSNLLASRVTSNAASRSAPYFRNDSLDLALRAVEHELMTTHASGARQWWNARRTSEGRLSLSATARAPSVGDLVSINTSLAACTSPSIRGGRVAAITQKAIIVADTTNPSGGFTDAEYASFGTTFDTLIDVADVAAFGAATDIDANGRVVIFFTRAVNEMTAHAAQAITLGFFYSRDLLPTTSCAGSNVAEMFYVLVPDPTGVVNGNVRVKSFVSTNTLSTLAHEYQHLINASRRLYVNAGAATDEEVWLNEGLSHVAEELVFYRSSRLNARTNIGAAVFLDPAFTAPWLNFMQQNYRRYRTYLPAPETNSPFAGGDLQKRGSAWSYLRYSADRLLTTDGDLWFRIVNSSSTGFANLSAAFGTDPQLLMRDWAMSVYLDDFVPGVSSIYTQKSWNTRAEASTLAEPFPLSTFGLTDGATSTFTLGAGGVSFRRFSIAAGQAGLLTVTAGDGSALPAGVKVGVARTK